MRHWQDAERVALSVGLVLLCTVTGCDDKTVPRGPAASAPSPAATTTATSTAPAPTAKATAQKPYTGPTGTVSGTITISGDPAPATPFTYPKECSAAAGMYGKLFRVGQEGGLADALVAVTHYEGFVPPKSDSVDLTIKNCAYSERTVALTDGQHLEVKNLDAMTSYIPHLDGARLPAGIVAVPLGDPVKLNTRGVQRYWLREQMGRTFMIAHVFHLPYSTTDVTDLSGKYEITGVPVGKAKVSVLLPQLMQRATKEVTVKAGENVVVDLELTFDAEKDVPADGHGGTKPDGTPGTGKGEAGAGSTP